MPPQLVLPTSVKPLNLSLPYGAKAEYIDGDLYGICRRIREEISEDIIVVALEHDETDTHAFAVMEQCRDGEVRLIFKVKELDGRVLHKLRKIMAVPFAERLRAAEEECAKHEREQEEKASDEFYERMGLPMLTELERCGFIQRPKSYAKRGHVGGKGSLKSLAQSRGPR